MQKVKVSLNKSVANLTENVLRNTNFVMQEADKNSCKSIYKNFNFNSKTKCADGDEMHFTAQMYNKYYTGRTCMLTFKNDAFVAMHTLD
jgi:hypothetical protein